MEIIYMSQVVTFNEEIFYLQTGKPVKENIPLISLVPFLNKRGLEGR